MDLSPGWITAGCAVVSLVGGGLIAWIRADLSAVKGTQRTLFAKHDEDTKELADYKLHVAETYANRAALKEFFDPVNKRLDSIESDLRGRGN